jgi:hypothetical protein
MAERETDWARAVGDAVAALLTLPLKAGARLATAVSGRGAGSCDIPEPCWLPRSAGTCELTVAPGESAPIRVHVLNCDWRRHRYVATAPDRLGGWLSIDPTTLVLDPQDSGTVVVTVRPPNDAGAGARMGGALLVYGCNVHAVRIQVRVAESAHCEPCDVSIEDCPDPIHHWYDHFYCYRPCQVAEGGQEKVPDATRTDTKVPG